MVMMNGVSVTFRDASADIGQATEPVPHITLCPMAQWKAKYIVAGCGALLLTWWMRGFNLMKLLFALIAPLGGGMEDALLG